MSDGSCPRCGSHLTDLTVVKNERNVVVIRLFGCVYCGEELPLEHGETPEEAFRRLRILKERPRGAERTA